MDLFALQLFCDLVDSGSFSRAADRNFVSQSAVSQRISTLEKDYEQTLLDRSKGKGRFTLTPAGSILYEGAKPLLREAKELEAQIRGLSDEVAGTVRVATVYSVGLHALPPRLKPFLAAHPRVNVHLEYSQTAKVYQDVLSSAVDVGIVACPAARAGIEVLPFGDEEMVLICATGHPFAGLESIALRQLEGQPFIAFDDEIPTRKLIDDKLRGAKARVRTVMAYDNIETIKNLVEIGSGVALVPEATARVEAREGTLAVVPLAAADSFRRPEGILLKKSKNRRAVVQAFLEAVKCPE